MTIEMKQIWALAPYKLEVLPTGKGHRTTYTVIEEVMVEVRCIPAVDAPVAFQADNVRSYPPLRYFDGEFWRACYGDHAHEDPLSLERFETLATTVRPRGAFSSPFVNMDAYNCKTRSEAEAASRKILKDERRTAAVNGQSTANNLLVIGGIVHRKACEPSLVIHYHDYEHLKAVKIAVDNHEYDRGNGSSTSTHFRLDHMDKALFLARALADRLDVEVENQIVPYQVVIPEALTINEDRQEALRAAAAMSYTLEKCLFDHFPDDTIQAWLDIRRLRNNLPTTGPEAILAVHEATNRFLRGIPVFSQSYLMDEVKKLRNMAALFLARCEILGLPEPEAAMTADDHALGAFAL